MYSFILALILGVYLYVRLSNDKSRKKKFSVDYNNARTEADMFYNTYEASVEETNKVRDMVLEQCPEIVQLEAELMDVIGMKPTHPMLIWGYLAYSGRIPHRSVSSDYNADNPLSPAHDRIWSGVVGWKEKSVVEIQKARLKFLIWYDSQLCSNGMEYKLMFSLLNFDDSIGRGTLKLENKRAISECRDLCSTAVFWEPTKLYVPNLNGTV